MQCMINTVSKSKNAKLLTNFLSFCIDLLCQPNNQLNAFHSAFCIPVGFLATVSNSVCTVISLNDRQKMVDPCGRERLGMVP